MRRQRPHILAGGAHQGCRVADELPDLVGEAGVGVALTVADGVITRARASFVSVTDVPDVLDLTEAVVGVEPGAVRWAGIDDVVASHVDPQADIHATADYRRALVTELTKRAFTEAATGAEERSA